MDNGIVDRTTITNYPTNDTYTSPNNFTQKLNGNGPKTGAGILLKVMAGDKINVQTGWWYKLSGANPSNTASPLPDIVNALINSVPGASGSKFLQAQLTSNLLNPSVTQFLNTRDGGVNTSRPRAWLNIILLDEQLNPVITNDGKNSYFQQVGASNQSTVQYMTVAQREITRSGYIYVYVSNESTDVNVYFDNLQVTHTRGPLLQEEGYYPFGLEMAALKSDAAVIASNAKQSYKFNSGTQLEESFDVNYYETYFRNYDAQIGRFTGVDMLAEKTVSITPYQYGANDPISYNDPSGALAGGFDINSITPHIAKWHEWDAMMGVPDANTYSGGWGGGSYAGFWFNLWNKAPDGMRTTYHNAIGGSNTSIRYEYTNGRGDGVFITPNYHGSISFTEGENYHFTGTEMVVDFSKVAEEDSGGIGAAILDGFQTGLDVVGLIPGVGEVADGINALIYTGRGDYVNAGLSAAAMIPIAGWAATGGKLAGKAHIVYHAVDKAGIVRYIGITSRDLAIREAEHTLKDAFKGLDFFEVGKTANRLDARIWEQTLINQHGLPNLLNQINSIAPSKWILYGIK